MIFIRENLGDFIQDNIKKVSDFDLKETLDRLKQDLTLKYNVYETEGQKVYVIALPGYDKHKVSVSYVKNSLVVKSTGGISINLPKGTNTLSENINVEPFTKSFPLTEGLYDSEKITAVWENGLLIIKVPKAVKEESKPVNINIQ